MTWKRVKGWTVGIPGVALLAAACWSLTVTSVMDKSATFDEGAYLVSGTAHWITGDYRLNPEAGPLPQRLAALALLPSAPALPPTDQEAWRTASHDRLGFQFLYESGNDADALLLRARALMALFAVALALTVYGISRRLFGPKAGFLSLVLCVFSPTVLGHGGLVTSDVPAALFFLLAVWCFWRLLHGITPGRLAASVLATGALFLTKLNAPLLFVVFALLVVVRLTGPRPLGLKVGGFEKDLGRPVQLVTFAGLIGAHVAVVGILVWAAFGFRYAPVPDESAASLRYSESWPAVQVDGGAVQDAITLARDHSLLPEAYLFGTARALKWSQRRNAFLDGEFSTRGWARFFPMAFAYKTPVALFALLILAAALSLAGGRGLAGVQRGLYRTAPLWALLAAYWLLSVTSHLNIGHRHLLPTYPVLFVLAGAAIGTGTGKLTRTVPTVALAALLVVGTLLARPHFIGYFNVFAGGSSQGYRHLVDSSLDWGQDLPTLSDILDAGDTTGPAYLSYFGTASPAHHGVRAKRLPGFIDFGIERDDRVFPLEPGTYCISATQLQRVFARHPGAWRDWYEETYRHLQPAARRLEKAMGKESALTALFEERPAEAWYNDYGLFADLRFGRLAACLRQREPDASAGHSILVYRVDSVELRKCLQD